MLCFSCYLICNPPHVGIKGVGRRIANILCSTLLEVFAHLRGEGGEGFGVVVAVALPHVVAGVGEGLVGLGRAVEVGVALLECVKDFDHRLCFQAHQAGQFGHFGRLPDHRGGCQAEVEVERQDEHYWLKVGARGDGAEVTFKRFMHFHAVIEAAAAAHALHPPQRLDVAREPLGVGRVVRREAAQQFGVGSPEAEHLLVERLRRYVQLEAECNRGA